MIDVHDMQTLLGWAHDYEAIQAGLASGHLEVQAQESRKAENNTILQALDVAIAAREQHLAELDAELARLQGQVIAADHRAVELPALAAGELNWQTIDIVNHVSGKLEGWAHLRESAFHPGAVRLMLLQYSKQLRELHMRLTGQPIGGA